MKTLKCAILLVIMGLCQLPGSSPSNFPYLLQKGDIITIQVMEHPEFSLNNIIVMPDGTIQYAAIGNIVAQGVSADSLSKSIALAIEDYVSEPVVSVYVNDLNGYKINILGNVVRAGSYQIFEQVDLLDALALAGGIKVSGNCKIWIIHNKCGESEQGNSYPYRLNSVIAQTNKPYVHPSDTIIVDAPVKLDLQLIAVIAASFSLLLNIYTATK